MENEIKVNIDGWIKTMVFIIMLASITMCANSEIIKSDINEIKLEILKEN